MFAVMHRCFSSVPTLLFLVDCTQRGEGPFNAAGSFYFFLRYWHVAGMTVQTAVYFLTTLTLKMVHCKFFIACVQYVLLVNKH